MEETLNMTLTSESLQHKVLLRKLEFGSNCKGLVCTKETRTSAFIYHLCAIFCCFIKYKFNHNLVDHISGLPDEILDNILSFLPLKEAVATSVLSRRWQYVWTSTRNLNFDVDKALPFLSDLKPKSQDRKSHRYADWVDRIVKRHIGLDIKKFRACFALDCRFASSIDKWIQFAMKKRVEVLVLDIIKLQGFCYKDIYSFPTKLLGLEKGPALDNCSGFKSLKVLYLENVDVTDEVVEYFLSHCPVLERLSVILAKSLANVRVIGPSVRLKYLELKLVYDLTMVQVCDTDLVSLVHVGYCDVELILSNVPFLVEVSVVGDLFKNPNGLRPAFTQISCCLSQLESLMVDLYLVEYNENYVFPVLENLKNLELSVEADYEWGLSHLSSFMKASPSLQRLVLKMGYKERERKKIKKAARVPHCNLRVVEVVGYRGRINVDEHVMYLVENAVELQKIVIDPFFKWLVHHTRADMGRIDLKKEAKARNHAMQRLKVKVPSTVEFICL